MENPHEQAARWTKAHKLAKVARAWGAGAEDVAGWADWEWEAARLLAGVKPPSNPDEAHRGVSIETRLAVAAFLADALPAGHPYRAA